MGKVKLQEQANPVGMRSQQTATYTQVFSSTNLALQYQTERIQMPPQGITQHNTHSQTHKDQTSHCTVGYDYRITSNHSSSPTIAMAKNTMQPNQVMHHATNSIRYSQQTACIMAKNKARPVVPQHP